MFTFPPPPFPVSCSWIRHPTLSDLYARHLDFKIMMRFYKKLHKMYRSINTQPQPIITTCFLLPCRFRKRHICITVLPHQLTPWQTSVEAATPRNKIQGRREASIWKDGTYPATSGPASERFQGGYFSLNISNHRNGASSSKGSGSCGSTKEQERLHQFRFKLNPEKPFFLVWSISTFSPPCFFHLSFRQAGQYLC